MLGTGINPEAFTGVSTTILKFHFQGVRRVVASHLCMTRDLDHELVAKAGPMVDSLYVGRIVRKVEIVTYGSGGWLFDEWPEALQLLDDAGLKTTLSHVEEPEDEPGEVDEE